MEKFSQHINLKVSPAMYRELLKEAGSERQIPQLIRDKLESSTFKADDARSIRALLSLAVLLLKELMYDNAPLLARMKLALSERKPEAQAAELRQIEQLLQDKAAKVERLSREVGAYDI